MLIDNLWNWLSSDATNIIALCALVATFWQADLSRRHNRLAVKPHIEIARGFDFNKQEYCVNMLNNGLGPALVTKIQLLVDGKEVNTQNSEAICDVISKVFHLYNYKQYYSIISGSYMMKPEEEKTFLKVELLSSLTEFPVTSSDEIIEINSRMEVKISYESMYGEKFKTS